MALPSPLPLRREIALKGGFFMLLTFGTPAECKRHQFSTPSLTWRHPGKKGWFVSDNVCPGFSQDRVYLHENPGRGTAGRAEPTWSNRTGYSIPCAIMLGSSGAGELGSRNSVTAQSRLGSARRRQSVRMALSVPAVCVVYSPYLYRCCYCSLCLLFC